MTPARANSLHIVTLCTGNVARSVMLGYMLTTLGEAHGSRWQVRTAGTLVAEGSAMSARTRAALIGLEELGPHHYNAHRSHQVSGDDLDWADVVLASEASHVWFVRRNFPDQSAKAVQLTQFVREAVPGVALCDQVAAVASRDPDPALDVTDPAGADQLTYDACARDLWALAQGFARLASP